MTERLGNSLLRGRGWGRADRRLRPAGARARGVGLYGVMAYGVSTRNARDRYPDGARRTGSGRAQARPARRDDAGRDRRGAGVALALAVSRMLVSFLYGISATDAATFVATVFVLAVVAFNALSSQRGGQRR